MTNTVVCVLRSGGVYTADWVIKLKRNVDRFSYGHRFVCLSDVAVPGVDTIKLEHDWPGWWSKMEMFKPGLLPGRNLYLDLDTVITANIEHLWAYNGFASLSDFYSLDNPASGVFLWTEPRPALYEQMLTNPPPMRSRSDFWWPQHAGKIDRLQKLFPGTFGSYKADRLDDSHKDFAVVCFHGTPKQPDVLSSWVGKYWQ